MKSTSLIVALAVAALGACSNGRAGETYFERNIQPILTFGCAGNTSGCHRTNTDDPYSFAAGNFDVTSFENVQKRRDLLQPFGAYSHPLLLIKAVPPGALSVAYGSVFKPIDVQHAGGPILEVGSPAYLTLQQWVENGATENGLAPPSPAKDGGSACSTAVPPGFVPAMYTGNASFAQFRNEVQPVLRGCAGNACHGAPQSDFYITCGDDETQLAFNFSQAWAFVATPVDDSQLLRVPLAVKAGGLPHTGGDQLPSRSDPGYTALRAWAEKIGPLDFGAGNVGKRFFADNVQPILLSRGCSFQACHSPSATNDFKLRTGTQGFFSSVALQRNYDLMRDEFMALEMQDARRGRAVAKSILPVAGGIAHRGGPVLETPGQGLSNAPCPDPYVPATATAFCTVQQWVNIERQALLTAGEVTPMNPGDTVDIVYVQRPANQLAGRLEFDTYQPGADLRVAEATFGANQSLMTVAASTSLLGGCGVAVVSADVQAPNVHRDGRTVVFAMRASAAEPLGVWTVDLEAPATSCRRITPAAPDQGGLKLHNFDPVWSPDGNWIVFASTRGRPEVGPTRTRKLFLPQADLWRMRADGSGAEQLTYLTNSEVRPAFMREGRITMTTEKVSDGFYQLAGRRLNWDRTDYHPLLAQRAESIYASLTALDEKKPSVGYGQATDIREDANGNFLVILSDPGTRGAAGTLAIFNRSVGPFEANRADDGFLAAMAIVDPAATGRAGPTAGAYRAPFGLPDGSIMASYAAFSGDLRNPGALAWDIVAVNPRDGSRRVLIDGGGSAAVDAVLALKHPARKLYENRRQLVFGGTVDAGLGDRATMYLPDAPMVFTLLNANLRRGRPLSAFSRASKLAVYREDPAPSGTTSGGGPGGIFQMRELLGTANLASDGSVRVGLPARSGVVLELQDSSGRPLITMGEEHQLGPGEIISLGIRRELFDAVCGGCHGSVSGSELDVVVTPDALTGASESVSKNATPIQIGN